MNKHQELREDLVEILVMYDDGKFYVGEAVDKILETVAKAMPKKKVLNDPKRRPWYQGKVWGWNELHDEVAEILGHGKEDKT